MLGLVAFHPAQGFVRRADLVRLNDCADRVGQSLTSNREARAHHDEIGDSLSFMRWEADATIFEQCASGLALWAVQDLTNASFGLHLLVLRLRAILVRPLVLSVLLGRSVIDDAFAIHRFDRNRRAQRTVARPHAANPDLGFLAWSDRGA